MSLSSVQPFLEQAFRFLCDRQFNVDQESWQLFCTKGEINSIQLKAAKLELSKKLEQETDRDKHESLQQQILCCNPFDQEIIKNLRDIWSDQPEPKKSWSYDLANHLVTLSLLTNRGTPTIDENKVFNGQKNKVDKIENKSKVGILKVIIASSISGIFIALGLIINNYINRQLNLAVTSPSITPSQANISSNPTQVNVSSSQNFVRQSEKEKLLKQRPVLTNNIEVDQSIKVIKSLYDAVSSKQFEKAYLLISPEMQSQFNPNFFEQFTKVTVENLQVVNRTDNSINFIGYNTYFYPDGSTQKEKRSYLLSSLDGQPQIVSSRFIKVIKLRR